MGCGYGPFDYGECECSADGLFDFYGTPQGILLEDTLPDAPKPGLVRRPMWFPTGFPISHSQIGPDSGIDVKRLAYDSYDRHQWNVPASPEVDGEYQIIGSLVGGFDTTQERVWCLERRQYSGVTKPYVALYDAVSRTQVVAHDMSAFGWTEAFMTTIGYAMHRVFGASNTSSTCCGANQTTLAIKTTGGHFLINAGGVTTALAQVTNILARRAYPVGCYAAGTEIRVGLFSSPTGSLPGYDSWSNGFDNLQIIHFDASYDDWVAVVRYINGSGITREAVVVNRLTVYDERVPVGGFGWGNFQKPHVSHPQEGTGDSYIVIPRLAWSSPPSSGNPSGTLIDNANPYTADIYRNGTLVGSLPRRNHPRIVHASSDRWMYVTGKGAQNQFAESLDGDVTKGKPFEMCRHDGSQMTDAVRWPAAVFNGGVFTDIQKHIPAQYGGENNGGIPRGAIEVFFEGGFAKSKHDCVKNSALVTLAPPANADEFGSVA